MLLFLLFLAFSHATKTLIIVRELVDKTTYSQFLRDLKNRGHELVFKTSTETPLVLARYGVYDYDNLILLSPNSKKLGDINSKAIMEYLDSGRNLFCLINNSPVKFYKNIAANLGIEIRRHYVRDHFHANELVEDSKNDTFITTRATLPSLDKPKFPIAYRGVAFTFKPQTQLGLHLLSAETTAYTTHLNAVNKHESGTQLGLVTSVQMRNNARITLVGSGELLSNEYAMMDVKVNGKRTQTGNSEFLRQAVAWTFQEYGKIRSRDAMHRLLDLSGPVNPNRYTVKEIVRYEVVLEQYSLKMGSWEPYVADDVEFQLVRLDPFIRTRLETKGDGLYFLEFMLPDTFGIFKFVVDYKRIGLSYIYQETEASVRPLRHDQHDRFLISAFPYYGAIMSMIFGFVTFGFLFLHSEEAAKKLKLH